MTKERNESLGGTASAQPNAPTPTRRSRWLTGVHGTLRFVVGRAPVLTMTVDDGEVRIAEGDGPADTTVICGSEDDVKRLVAGELNIIITGLLGRLELEGDVALGLQVLHALRDVGVPRQGVDHAA
jgi:hypothetical protein